MNHVGAAVVKRLLQAVITILVISVVIFVATQALPGDVATILGGTDATSGELHDIREQLGLNDPFVVQYWQWLSGLCHGNFGTSLVSDDPIGPELYIRGFNTFCIVAISLVVVISGSLLVGMYAAWRRDRAPDKAVMGISVVGNAVPDFVVGTFLVFLLSTSVVHWLPAVSTIKPGEYPWQSPASLIMPCLTLIIPGLSYLSRLVRAGLIDILDSEYVQMANLKGVKPVAVLFRHALPNALSAAIPAFSLVAALMVGAVVIVEYLFNYPGLGGYLLDGIKARDLPVIQGTGVIIGATVYLLNLIADLLTRKFSI